METSRETVVLSPKLKLNEILPYLDLPSNGGVNINLWDFKQKKNLVVFFNHGLSCSRCIRKLSELALMYKDTQHEDAEIISVSFDKMEDLERYAEDSRISFPLLSDVEGSATEMFTHKDEERKAPTPSILIADRFGVLRYQKIAQEAEDLPDAEEILSWLSLIESECPECSHL